MTTGVLIPHSNKLVLWFAGKFNEDPSQFPGIGKRDYVGDFIALDKYLNNQVHIKTEVLARIVDGEGYLTDHGPEHIKMVMHRACSLITCPSSDGSGFNTKLTPYEAFLLLMAIHFHDVGNRYGREGHETRILDVMAKIPQMGSFPPAEQRLIARIASTHGGRVGHDKDTIRKLLPEGIQSFGSVTYRPQMLAALLRFADELAEDNSRADNFALLGTGEIPLESQIYHKYAQRLDSIAINSNERRLDMEFSIYQEDVEKRFGKRKNPDGTVNECFLLDEILERTKKTFLEAIYCNRFLRDELGLSFTSVNVVVHPFQNPQSFEPFRPVIRYSLKEHGYPFDKQSVDITQLCPELKGISGAVLKQELESLGVSK